MAVSAVKIANIIGVMSQLDNVIGICGRSHIFHPEEALSFYSDTHNFSLIYEENPYEKPLHALTDTLTLAGKPFDLVDTEKGQLSKEEAISYVGSFTEEMGALLNKRTALKQELDRYRKSVVEMSHFLGLQLDLHEIFACKFIKVRFGRIPKESYEKLESYRDNPYLMFFQCTSDKTHYWGVYFAPIDYADEIDRIFSGLYFERLRVPKVDTTPEETVSTLQQQIAATTEACNDIQKDIDALWDREKEKCLQVYSLLEELDTYFGMRRYAARYNNSFVLTGWILADEEKSLADQLNQVEGIEFSIDPVEDALKHEPPVKLKNKRIFRPFEFFVDMYGLPQYNEVDPTPFVAITYTILFGIMFGDLGQGLVLSVVGYLMWRLKGMKLGKILIPCGISSAIFGLFFGSVFGLENALDPLYKLLFNMDEKPIEVMQPQTTTMIILSAVGIGILLVMIAMLINIYSSFKQRNYEKAIFGANGICGFIFYVSLIAGILGMVTGHSLFNLPYVLCLLILPLLCILMREPLGKLAAHDPDWKPESWGGYVVQNIFELIEVLLSYVTNTMSFLRVGAFVLVHAGMMLMVFTLANLFGSFGYVVTAVIGNIIVMAMEGLLVGIQVLRLEFYEMFSRFFEGGGRPFTPVLVEKH